MGNYKELNKELAASNREVREHIPEAFAGFAELHRGAMAEGELSAATKELIALAMAMAQQCDGCIASHARGAARRGATAQQLAETIGVAMLMMGGPGTVYGPRAWDAYQEFAGPA